MAQLQRSSNTQEYPRSPQAHATHAHAHAQTSPMIKQHLQENDSRGWESKNSSPIYDRNYDHNKKSVFMKVKEKAKQLRHSLSGKKKHGMGIQDDTSPHSQDVKYEHAEEDEEDDEDDEDDEDSFGAPMYECEQPPESTKQNSGQHQPADPVIPGNLALPNNMNTEVKLENSKSTSPSKTITETVSDATYNMAAKIAASLTITDPASQDTDVATSTTTGSGNVEGLKNLKSKPETIEHSANNIQTYDKGVSVKEYFGRKLEPGQDDKALSRAISDSLSPSKSPRQKGVVDKFRDAVSSILWSEEQSDYTIQNDNKSLEKPVYNPQNPSPNVPVPTNISEAIEEKSHGRVLQIN